VTPERKAELRNADMHRVYSANEWNLVKHELLDDNDRLEALVVASHRMQITPGRQGVLLYCSACEWTLEVPALTRENAETVGAAHREHIDGQIRGEG
jgi:hypothetical protein